MYREQKLLYRQQRQWSIDQKVNFKDNHKLKEQLLSKRRLLKDSDFKCMHDRKLPVAIESKDTVVEFLQTIEKDVRFLESLRIMDYSLFLIVLQVPKQADPESPVSLEMIQNDVKILNNANDDSLKSFELENKIKEDVLNMTLDELVRHNRFVMYSPSKRFVYIMGLIDYLGKWNINKRSEMYTKTFLAHFIRQNTDFSVKPPHEFADRFLKKIKRVFKVQSERDHKKTVEQYAEAMTQDNNYFFPNGKLEVSGSEEH